MRGVCGLAPWPRTCDNRGAMKPIKSLFVLAFLLVPGVAAAQGYYGGSGPGYYGQQPATALPGGFHNRMGRLAFGGSVGLGGMHDDIGDINCSNCSDISGEL